MLDAEEFARLSGHLGAEDLVAISTGILCGVHRDIRIVDEAVVHLLEAIEVDEEDGNKLVGAFGTSESLIESITKQSSIRQTRQVVVECLVCQLLFELDSFRDVSRIENDATDPPLLAQVGHMRLQVPQFAGSVEHSKDDIRRAPVNSCGVDSHAVVRVQKPFEAATEKLG